jgi:2-succinyl-6-hydroxy-2,4-cyclohexadiene-1-carboxylate synthase
VPLHVELRGEGPPLVLLHGFTQTGRLWGSFGERLARSHTLIAPDLPGHAGSDALHEDLPNTAAMVAEVVHHAVGDTPCDVLGYSMGARVALHMVTGTDLAPSVAHLVCIGATAGIESPSERERRRAADEAAADALEGSGDLEAFLDSWLAGPLFERLGAAADRTERRRNTAPGLASSLRLCGTGTQEPLWTRLGEVVFPVLAIAGSDDSRFAAHALRVARLVPRGVASLVPGGGHAAHLAQPEQTWRLVEHWLKTVDSS